MKPCVGLSANYHTDPVHQTVIDLLNTYDIPFPEGLEVKSLLSAVTTASKSWGEANPQAAFTPADAASLLFILVSNANESRIQSFRDAGSATLLTHRLKRFVSYECRPTGVKSVDLMKALRTLEKNGLQTKAMNLQDLDEIAQQAEAFRTGFGKFVRIANTYRVPRIGIIDKGPREVLDSYMLDDVCFETDVIATLPCHVADTARLLALGARQIDIAEKLGISDRTVRSHVKLLAKLLADKVS